MYLVSSTSAIFLSTFLEVIPNSSSSLDPTSVSSESQLTTGELRASSGRCFFKKFLNFLEIFKLTPFFLSFLILPRGMGVSILLWAWYRERVPVSSADRRVAKNSSKYGMPALVTDPRPGT